jgi:ubiquinone biosynthesis protein
VEEGTALESRPGLELIEPRTSRPAVAGAVPQVRARMRWLDFVWRSAMIDAVALAALVWVGAASMFLRGEPGDPERDEKQARLYGRALRWALATLGATFTKLGQVLSTRPDLLPRPMIEELRKLQDKLAPFPFAAVRGVIESELGCRLEDAFAELDEVPVAAASVAQVHRGRLHDGTEVAVKVLRPDVRDNALRDGAILTFWAKVLEVHPRAKHAELENHLAHFVEGILQQTELSREVAHYAKFRANFEGYEGVEFPRVFEALSGERVMTMEFVRGRKVDELERGEFPELAARLRRMFLKMLFEDGFLHADLHPGNLVVKEDGTVAIFDVGLCKELTEELLLYYIDFNKCLVMGGVEETMQHLRTFHRYVEGTVDWRELEKDITVFAGAFRAKKASELEISDMINEIFTIGRKYGVRPIPDMTLIMVGVVTAEGIGKQLDPDSNSMGETASFLLPVLARRNMLTPELMAAAAARLA